MELSPQQDVYYIDTVSPIDYFIDTVTPSAIQLNKEKTMSIELDGPLYLGSNSLQQQVDQNTEDITELQSDMSSIEGDIGSLDNLATSDKSSLVNAINETLSVLDPTQTADYIKNSKGLESGEISTNASILPWVEEMSHSTFDASKFTVVGSPNITDDGILTGAASSGVEAAINITSGQKVQYKFPYTHKQNSDLQFILATLDNSDTSKNLYLITNRNNQCNIAYSGIDHLISNFNFVVDQTYDIELDTDYNTYVKVFINGVEKYNVSNLSLNYGANGFIIIGNNAAFANNRNMTGSIDLKQFSITIDGVEVFSGNKTGIDTIKPDDYTVEGSPTISTEGIASGFSDSNYIIKTGLSFGSSTWEIQDAFIFKLRGDASMPGANQALVSGGSTNASAPLFYVNNKGFALNIPSSVGVWGWQIPTDGGYRPYPLVDGNKYYYKIGWDGTNYYIKVSNNNKDWTLVGSLEGTAMLGGSGSFDLYIGANPAQADRNFAGSIDLNAFKIYVNSNLVYQPCLKIPYTESKTGSKIVDSIYRDRVNDMAEQFGFAPYYTLSDTDFTLPQVELYGLIGQRTLRDSYRNGINYWELYSNRDLEQGGSCTSGVEVTFARPFADTNYVLSVPYSAKSTTAFTPTQTGDWIAKGKGIL